MTRVIAGSAKGRKLAVPNLGTRPTSDKIRESIFARLSSWNAIEGARTLDLFAGSGALGIEALSRGAASAVFVEHSPAAAAVLKKNLTATGFSASARVEPRKVAVFLRAHRPAEPYELVFLDPPYALTELDLGSALQLLVPMLTDDATVVVERDARSPAPTLPEGLDLLGHRKWGDTAAWYVGPDPGEK